MATSNSADFKKSTLKKRQPKIGSSSLKLENVLLYVLNQVGSRPNVGETVLYKLLYFIDFDYYEKYEQSITGLKYVKNHYGPTPKQKDFKSIVSGMQEEGRLKVVSVKFHEKSQKKYIPNDSADLRLFNGQELQHIDQVLSRLADKTATQISDYAHQDTPWVMTEPNQEINYQLTKYRTIITSVNPDEDEL